MKTIIATIKPVHLDNIRRGAKLYEIRKTCPKEFFFKVLCCESQSGGKIKAQFVVDYAEQEHMVDYCNTKGRRVRNISEFGLKRPPQSWQYVRVEEGAKKDGMD